MRYICTLVLLQILPILLIVCLTISTGCAAQQKEIRISAQGSEKWQIFEDCGYEGCDPLVDFLKGPDITLRIEVDEGRNRQFFVVRVKVIFVRDDLIQFSPLNLRVTSVNNDNFATRVFTCSNTIWDQNFLRTRTALSAELVMRKNDCYLLFIDKPLSSVKGDVVLNLNGSMSKQGKSLDIPLIHFKKMQGQ